MSYIVSSFRLSWFSLSWISNPLEVVDRGSETQLQVGDNLNYSISRFKGQTFHALLVSLVISQSIIYRQQTTMTYDRLWR